MRTRSSRRTTRTTLVAALSTLLLPVTAAHAADTPAATPADSLAVARAAASTDTFGRAADAVFTDRTAALLSGGQRQLTAARSAAGVHLSAALARTENTALTSLRGTRSRLASLGEAYRAADTDVHVDRTRIRGGKATVSVTETTTLTYQKIRGDEPATTSFRAHHDLTFTAAPDGTWQLTGVRLTDKGPRPVNEPVPAAQTQPPAPVRPRAVVDAPRSATSYPAPANPKKLGTGTTYDYAGMARYAEQYWRNYNPSYRRFNNAGGDCTNFLSQSLKAGGWKTVTNSTEDYDTWWYGTSSQSDTWVGVNEWSWFTQTVKRTTALANAYQMDIGDVLQVDFDKDGSKDHSMITTYRSSSGVPYLTYHDVDTYRRSLASIVASYPNAAYYAYRS